MFSLKNKKADITGAGNGVGRSMAILFAKQGAEVSIIELNNVTAGGLLFIEAIRDSKFRAFNERKGELLFETELPEHQDILHHQYIASMVENL